MTIRPDPARLYDSRSLLPDLAELRLGPSTQLEAVAETLRDRGLLIVDGRELTVLSTGVFPAEYEDLLDAVVVVVAVEADGSEVTLYLD